MNDGEVQMDAGLELSSTGEGKNNKRKLKKNRKIICEILNSIFTPHHVMTSGVCRTTI